MNESNPIAKNITENTEENLIIQWLTQHHWTIRKTTDQEVADKKLFAKEALDKELIDKEAAGKTFAQKTWQFKNYREINAFLPRIAALIRDCNHHPDLIFKAAEKTLTVELTTHCAGNTLSQRDLDFAKQLETF